MAGLGLAGRVGVGRPLPGCDSNTDWPRVGLVRGLVQLGRAIDVVLAHLDGLIRSLPAPTRGVVAPHSAAPKCSHAQSDGGRRADRIIDPTRKDRLQ